MEKELKACIFDLDGVLVDTAKYHYLSWQKLASNLGFEFTQEDNEQLKGISRMASLEIVLSKGNINATDDEKENMCRQKNDWYIDYIGHLDRSELLPGVDNMLNQLKTAGIKIALGSASKNARMVLDMLNITEIFDVIVDGTNVTRSKPDPEVFLKGARDLNVEPDQCIVFEDAEKGLIAAKAGGFACLGIGADESLAIADLQIPSFENYRLEELMHFWQSR